VLACVGFGAAALAVVVVVVIVVVVVVVYAPAGRSPMGAEALDLEAQYAGFRVFEV